jgi:hypothetical protein
MCVLCKLGNMIRLFFCINAVIFCNYSMRGMILHASPSTVHTQLPNPDSFPISSTVAPQRGISSSFINISTEFTFLIIEY